MAKKRKAHFPKRSATEQRISSNEGTAGRDWARCTLAAELLSDAHLGSGSGGGGIDALIARDRHGRPVIWASHLEGVLRDAARRLRGDQAAGDFFGRAGGERQRAVFTSLYAGESPQTHVWRSTAREAFDNRAPKDDTLRVVEHVPRGTKLVGEIELPAKDLPVLRRLLQEVEAFGGGRSSGAGRVALTIAEVSTAPRKVGTPSGRLILLLKNRDPLCITSTAAPDNVIPSLSFVPGRTLLGAVAAWLIAEGDRDAAALLTSGRIQVSDALPLPQTPTSLDSVEILPVPLSLQSKKPEGSAGDKPWWAGTTRATRRLDAFSAADELKRPEDDLFAFRAAPNEPWITFRPTRRVRLRNGRPDPTQADASLFAIEQIVEDTHFLAELRGSPDNMKSFAAMLAPVLDGRRWLRVGRAGAPVEVAQLAWCGAVSPVNATGTALLTLTSDLLVRDEHLRWRTALDEAALRELLGADELRLGRSLQDSVMVHGFNGTSRLWRMPASAIRRGSVYVVSGDLARIARRISSGQWLGERVHEGFGRFRLDTLLPGVVGEAVATSVPVPAADSAEEAVAARTHEWFTAHRELAKAQGRSDRKPSLSQWLALVAALNRGDRNAIAARLNPTSAGERVWLHDDAREILEALKALPEAQRPSYAHFFVRWLRAALRREAR